MSVMRPGPPFCILSVLSPPNGSHRIRQTALSTEAQSGLPCFAPEGVAVATGQWYHEIEVGSTGLIQAGYCIPSKFKSNTGSGNGVGDDTASWAIDGSKKKLYIARRGEEKAEYRFTKGDTVGFALDADAGTLRFSINGQEVALVNLADQSDYVRGDFLQPAVSLNSSQSVTWRFHAAAFKYPQAGYEPLQQVSYPAELALEINTPPPATVAQADALDHPELLQRLLTGYQPHVNSPGAAAAVKKFCDLRGSYFEYGLDHQLGKGPVAKLPTAFEGALPLVKLNSSFASSVDDAKKLFDQIRIDRRTLGQWLTCFMSVFGGEEAARPIVDRVAEVEKKFFSLLPESNAKLRYLVACASRTNGFCSYGIDYDTNQFVRALDKDQAGMSASALESHVKDLTKLATAIRGWRGWFVEQVGDLEIHTLKTNEVDALLSRFDALFDPRAMDAAKTTKMLAQFEVELDTLIQKGRRDITDAKAEFERFPERAAEKYAKLQKTVDEMTAQLAAAEAGREVGEVLPSEVVGTLKVAALASTPKFLTWAGELRHATEEWSRAEQLRLLERSVADTIRTINHLLDSGKDLVGRSRVEEAIEKAFDAKERVRVLKSNDAALSLATVINFLHTYEGSMFELEKSITDWQLDRTVSTALRELDSAINAYTSSFEHNRNEEALTNLHKAKEQLDLLESNTAWSEVASVRDAIASAREKNAAFLVAYKERVVSRECKDAIRAIQQHLTSARGEIDHHNEQAALESLQKAEDASGALKSDAMMSTLPLAAEFLSQFGVDYSELQRRVNAATLEREVTSALQGVGTAYTEMEAHFEHFRFEQALEALAKYRELVDGLERDTRFRGHPRIEEALRESDVRVPAFEEKYRATMLQRSFESTQRDTDALIRQANDAFDHSNFPEALTKLHQYREAIHTIRDREEYGLLGTARDEYVRTAVEQLMPEFQKKYQNQVLSRAAAELVRELERTVASAAQLLDQSRFEDFLGAIQKARDQAAQVEPTDTAAESDAVLIAQLPQVKTALQESFDRIWSLSQSYDGVQLDRRVDEGIRAAEGLLKGAEDALGRFDFVLALTKLSETRESSIDFVASVNSPRVASWSNEFDLKMKDFQTRLDAAQASRRLADTVRALTSSFDSAQRLFDQYRNEESLAQLRAARDSLAAFEDEFPTETATTDKFRALGTTFETAYRERVQTRAAADAISRANAELTFAEAHLDHYRDEKALESLNAARSAAAMLSVDERFKGLASIAAFEAAFTPRLAAFTQKCDARTLERESNDVIRQLDSSLGEMEAHFAHHRHELALQSQHVSLERRTALQAARFAQLDSIRTADQQAEARLAKFKTDYFANRIASQLESSTKAALSALSQAQAHLEHSRLADALERFQVARELAGVVGADPMLVGLPQVDSFLGEFGASAEKLRLQIAATARERAQADAERTVSSAMTSAASQFDHHNNEASLVSLNQARQALEAFSGEFGSEAAAQTFIRDQTEKQTNFERAYAERVFQAEIDRKISKAQSRLAAANSATEHHRYEEALRTLVEADECASLLGGDDRFLKLASVDAFLKSHAAASRQLRDRLNTVSKEREAAELGRAASQLVSQAENLFAHHRYEEAIAAYAKTKEALERDVAPQPTLTALHTQLSGQVQSIRTRLQTEVLGREAVSLIRATNSHLDNAEYMVSHHRQEDALGALAKARESATQLGDDTRFEGVAAVDTFFASWPARVKAVQTGITEKLQAKRARDAIIEVRTPLDEAALFLDRRVYETALQRLHTASERADALKADSDLATVPSVIAFLAEFASKQVSLSTRIAVEVYGKEVNEAIHTTRSRLQQAVSLFERFAYEPALAAYQEARDSASTVSGDDRLASAPAWRAFVQDEFTPKSVAFTANYAEKVLDNEARTIAATVRPLLAQALVFLERGVRAKAEESLSAARDAAAPLLDTTGMLHSLPVSIALTADLRAAQTKFATLFLQEEATAAIAAARKQLDLAIRAESRALDFSAAYQAAQEAAAPLLGSSLDQSVSDGFAALPSVVSFVGELVPALAKAGVTVFAPTGAAGSTGSAGPTAVKKKGGKGGDTVDAILGPRLPLITALRKGLPKITFGTDVHPKFFARLKKTNLQAEIVATNIRQLEERVKSCNLAIDYAGSMEVKMNVQLVPGLSWQFESTEEAMCEFGKELARLQADVKDEPVKDPLIQKMIDGFAAFSTAFKETVEVLEKFDDLTSRGRSVFGTIARIDELLKASGEIASRQCPTEVKLSSGSKVRDDQLYLDIIKMASSSLANIELWSKEYDGAFMRKKFFTDAFTTRALKAKKQHVDHCVRQVAAVSRRQPQVVQRYMKALSSFPLAQVAAVKIAQEFADLTSSESSVTLPTPTSNPDPDEKPEWYAETCELVVPGPSNKLPFNNMPDDSSTPADYPASRQAAAGKILFSRKAVPESGDAAATANKFDLAEVTAGDGIFARAFWPRSLRNYAMGRQLADGAPLYGPKGLPEVAPGRVLILMFLKIDGVEVRREQLEDSANTGAFTLFTEFGNRKRDLWTFCQTQKFSVLASDMHTDDNMSDEWTSSPARFAYHFSLLSPGEHKVELDFRYQFIPTEANFLGPKRIFPWRKTPVSEPIAAGAFTLVVPNKKVPRRSVLPVAAAGLSDSPSELAALHAHLLEALRKHEKDGPRANVLSVAMLTNFYGTSFEVFEAGQKFVKRPTQNARDLKAAFMRRVRGTRDRDHVLISQVAAYGAPSSTGQPVSSLHPVHAIYPVLDSSYRFDVELLSEADAALEIKE